MRWFSPDAEFPLINGEKGNTSFEIKFPQTQDSVVPQLKSFQAGLKENMVPRDATAVLTSDEPQTVVKAFNDFLQTVPVTGSSETESNLIRLAIVGKAAHGMEPKKRFECWNIFKLVFGFAVIRSGRTEVCYFHCPKAA